MKEQADGFPPPAFLFVSGTFSVMPGLTGHLIHSTYTPYFRQWRMPKKDITM
jgi:hypothetical protein